MKVRQRRMAHSQRLSTRSLFLSRRKSRARVDGEGPRRTARSQHVSWKRFPLLEPSSSRRRGMSQLHIVFHGKASKRPTGSQSRLYACRTIEEQSSAISRNRENPTVELPKRVLGEQRKKAGRFRACAVFIPMALKCWMSLGLRAIHCYIELDAPICNLVELVRSCRRLGGVGCTPLEGLISFNGGRERSFLVEQKVDVCFLLRSGRLVHVIFVLSGVLCSAFECDYNG